MSDNEIEEDETLLVNLSNPAENTRIWNFQGVGTILDDDYSEPLPDIKITEFNSPTTITPGEEIELNWEVVNQGDIEPSFMTNFQIYLSKDDTLDPDEDILISSQWPELDINFEPEQSHQFSQQIRIFEEEKGDHHLIILAQPVDSQIEQEPTEIEQNLTNNIKAIPVELIELKDEDKADLVIKNIAIEESTQSDGETSMTISWDVTNKGKANTEFSSWFFLSDDQEISEYENGKNNDILLGTYEESATLKPDQTKEFTQEFLFSEEPKQYLLGYVNPFNSDLNWDDNTFVLDIPPTI